MNSFQFQSPWILAFVFIIPALLLVYYRFGRRENGRPATMQHAATSLIKGLPRSWKAKWRPILPAMRLATVLLIIIGVARPQIVQGKETVTGEGIDIALALDISGSMASLDFEPDNRLEASKTVIDAFVEERPYDKIGLVVFASEAFAQSPLTMDHNMVSRSLDQVQLATDLGLQDGTAIGSGMANAANMLTNSDAESKVIILLTDGVNNSGQIDPLTAAEAAKALGIKVYTIGAGRPGEVPVPVPSIFGGTTVQYQESQLDEETLRQVADITGGQFFRATDMDGLKAIYDEINELETSQIEIQVYNQYIELMVWLLLPALLIFMAEMFLRETVFRTIP